MERRGERKKKRGDDVGRRGRKCPGDAHGIGKVSWQPACCHGDGMTVRQPGKQGCRLPRTTARLGGQTKNFLCRLADEGGRFCRRRLLLRLGVDATRDETEQDELRSAPRRRKEKRSRGEDEGRVGGALRRGNKCVLARGGRRAAGGGGRRGEEGGGGGGK